MINLPRWPWLPHASRAAFVLTIAIGTIFFGADASWDLKNYHVYNAYAFLDGRHSEDIAIAQLQTYFNPLIDVPFYIILEIFNDQPWVLTFYLGLYYGACLLLLWEVSNMVCSSAMPSDSRKSRYIFSTVAVVVGGTGAATLSVAATTFNELQPSVLVLLSLALSLMLLRDRSVRRWWWLPAIGFFVGAATALKLSYVVYAVGVGAGLFALTFTGMLRIKELLLSGVGVVVGFLLFGAGWFWFLYQEFGNPLFPFFNNLFQSPYASIQPYTDVRFRPDNLWQSILYPFIWSRDVSLAAELKFQDFRFATITILFLIFAACISLISLRDRSIRRFRSLRNTEIFLFVFFLTTYALWLNMYGIYRYLATLEMLAGTLFVVLCLRMFRGSYRLASVLIGGAILIATTQPPNWGRTDRETFIAVYAPELPDDALVIVATGWNPVSYIVPFLNENALFVAVNNTLVNLTQDNAMTARVQERVANHSGPLLVLRPHESELQEINFGRFGVRINLPDCARITTNLSDTFSICPAQRYEISL